MKRVARGKARGWTGGGRPSEARVEETILLLLVLVEPLLFTPWTRNPFAAKDLIFAAALLALAAARFVVARKRRVPLRAPLAPAAALALVVALHLALAAGSSAPAVSVAHVLRMLGYASLFLLVASRTWDMVFFRRFAAVILAGAVVASLYGLLQVVHLDPVPWADSFRVAGAPLTSMRVFSTFGHPNFFGAHLAMALSFAGVVGLLSESRVERVAAAGGILLGVSCLLLTLSRGAWVGFLAAGIAVAALFWRAGGRIGLSASAAVGGTQRTRAIAGIGGLALVAGLAAVVGSPALRHRLDLSGGFKEPTVQSRLLIWSGALQMIRDRPWLGFGPGTFGGVFPFYRDERLADYHDELVPVTHAHNEYLEVLAESGGLGFLALGVFVAVAVRRGWKKVRTARSDQERIIAGALLAGVVSLLVGSLFGVELRNVNAALFLWLLLGFMASEPAPAAAAGGAGRETAGRSPVLTAVACGAGAGVFFVAVLRMFVGEALLARAEGNLAAGLHAASAAEGKAARAWNPADQAGLMLAAEALVRSQQYPEARELYSDVQRSSPGEPLIGYDLALMDYFLGDYDAGLKEVEAARKLYPRHAPTLSLHYDLWLKKGLEGVKRNDLESAKVAFRAAGAIKPGDPRAIFYLGNVNAQEGLYGAAADRYRLALRADPTFAPAAENLKRVAALAGK